MNREKRRSVRKAVDLVKTVISYKDEKYNGVIEDMSEHGLKVIAASKDGVSLFLPETVFKVEYNSASEEEKSHYCEIRWVHINRTPVHGLTYRLGMEIIQGPEE